MDNFNSQEMKSKRTRAEEELYKMWEKSTLPHVPPFVKMPNGTETKQNPLEAEPVLQETPPPKPREKRGIGGLLGKDIFKFLDLKNFELNSDRMLILLMLVLLSGEDSDNILLFALAYIML